MKHWHETRAVFERIGQIRALHRHAAVAVVTAIVGSAYRRPGAKLLVEDDGVMLGGVSGGCLEADVKEHALQVLRTGQPQTLHYYPSNDESMLWGLGLGCYGAVDLFVFPTSLPGFDDALATIQRHLQGDDPFALCVTVGGGKAGQCEVQEPGPAVADNDRFVEILDPPPYLLICGAGDDAIPLAHLGRETGFRVAVADHRPAYLSPERFPDAIRCSVRPGELPDDVPLGTDTYAVVMTHGLEHDTAWFTTLHGSDVPYIGMLGPKARTQQMIDAHGGNATAVYGPVGVDIGGDGPEHVAISILAEVVAVWSGTEPQHLRDKQGPIHGV